MAEIDIIKILVLLFVCLECMCEGYENGASVCLCACACVRDFNMSQYNH